MDTPLPKNYQKVLLQGIEEAMSAVEEAHAEIRERQVEDAVYYQPIVAFVQNVRQVHADFNAKAQETLRQIESETEQLIEIRNQNLRAIQELNEISEFLSSSELKGDEHPVLLFGRAMAFLLPLISFGVFSALY